MLLAVKHQPKESLSLITLAELHNGVIAFPPGDGHGLITKFFLPDAEEDIFPPGVADVDWRFGFYLVVWLWVYSGEFGVIDVWVDCFVIAH